MPRGNEQVAYPETAPPKFSHRLPLAKHPVTGSIMRTRDIRESGPVGVGPVHSRMPGKGEDDT